LVKLILLVKENRAPGSQKSYVCVCVCVCVCAHVCLHAFVLARTQAQAPTHADEYFLEIKYLISQFSV